MRLHHLLLFLSACHAAPTAITPAPAAPVKVNDVAAALAPGVTLDADDPATCAVCHEAVVSEWNESLHSRAHHANDPLYARLRTLRTERQGAGIPDNCARCHNPRDPVNHDTKPAQLGVTCTTCHQLSFVHATADKKGVTALVAGPDKTFRGARDIPNGTAPLHATGPALPELADGKTLCLACHAEEKNAAGLATCSTGPEYAASAETKSCAQCHMAEVNTPSGAVSTRPTHRSHRFAGPHQAQRLGEPGVLAEAVALSGRFEGDTLVARIDNRSAHAFPSGFPARLALLLVSTFDASGKKLSDNITSDPMKEHPEAVFNKGYLDADGKPSLAPFALKLARDNRLRPAESRTLVVPVPPGAVRAELRLRYFLVAPPAAKLMAYEGRELAPVTLAPVVVVR